MKTRFLIASLILAAAGPLAACAPFASGDGVHASGSPGAPPAPVPSELTSSADIAAWRAGFQAGFGDGYQSARSMDSGRAPDVETRYKRDPVFRLGYLAGHDRGTSEGSLFGGGGSAI